MDGAAIGARAVADAGARTLPSEAAGPRAAGTRHVKTSGADGEPRSVVAGDSERAARASRP